MQLRYALLLVASISGVTAAYQRALPTPVLQPIASTTGPSAIAQANDERTQEVNDRYAKQVLERIAGREQEPAGGVFKNIQIAWLKAVPARVFITIMNRGYSRALGVSCTHCHVEQDFASDDKRPKRAAREMAVMHRMVNEQLAKMENLVGKPEERAISCIACHRGTIDPRTAR
jgi:hypothetical protein